jgi:hypothetical protein
MNSTYLGATSLKLPHTSFPCRRESSDFYLTWIPAYAGMTMVFGLNKSLPSQQ